MSEANSDLRQNNICAIEESAIADNTSIDKILDVIGVGYYQCYIFLLTGLGWATDNMWIQGASIAMPYIQMEWKIQGRWLGLLPSSIFAGMMTGALAWGFYSDKYGRRNTFFFTLPIAACFASLAVASSNMQMICASFYFMGLGLGGSVPIDGIIFMEILPAKKQHYIGLLCIFFSAGGLLAAITAYIILSVHYNKDIESLSSKRLDSNTQGSWRHFFTGLDLITILFILVRSVFFDILESPKFLFTRGKLLEACSVLQQIAKYNGKVRMVYVCDLDIGEQQIENLHTSHLRACKTQKADPARVVLINVNVSYINKQAKLYITQNDQVVGSLHSFDNEGRRCARWLRHQPKAIAKFQNDQKLCGMQSASRFSELFSPSWRKRTILVWSVWTVFNFAYTLVTAFLPIFVLNMKDESLVTAYSENPQDLIAQILWMNLLSIPGSLVGMLLCRTKRNKVKFMAASTLLFAISVFSFTLTRKQALSILFLCGISLFSSISFVVMYNYSAALFKASLRGVALGIASALSRFGTICAPSISGHLMETKIEAPLYLSGTLLIVSFLLQLLLPPELITESH